MKHFVKLAIVAAAALLAACSTDNTVTDNEPKINIKIHAGFPQTRTTFGDKNEETNSYPVFWDDNDSFAIVEHIAGAQSQVVQAFAENISDDRKSAEIFAELSIKRGSSFDYYAYSPYKAYSEGKMIIPAAQTPSATSVDPSALLLFASKEGLTTQTPELDLSFGHIAAYARMTVYGLSGENDDIVSVTFSADADLAGTVDVESGTVTNGSKSVTLDVSSLGYTTADKFDIWFTAAPQEEISKFSVDISTQKGNYTKDFTVSGDKPLAFRQGVVSNFTINMSDAEDTSNEPIKDNEIHYISTDNNIVSPDIYTAKVISNTCKNNKGVIVFDRPITTIPDSMFDGCTNLQEIILPNSVTSIERWVFYHCRSLTKIKIPERVTFIGHYAFDSCGSLTEINIPDNVTSIGIGAFSDCSNLTKINIPDGVTYIEHNTFYNCSSLTKINIPGSVTSIRYNAFESCSSLVEINIPGSVTSIEEEAFSSCSNLTDITISDGVTYIGDRAFYECRSLTEITIPGSVTSIGYAAFYMCSRLTKIYCKPAVPPTLEEITGHYIPSTATIYVPTDSVETYKTADGWVNYANQIVGYDF